MPDPTDLLDIPLDTFFDVLEDRGRPVVTASEVARVVGCSHATAEDALSALASSGQVERLPVESDPVVWYPTDWKDTTDRERIVVFPERRELIVDSPKQFTRAMLSQFARLVDTNRQDGYRYEIRAEDIWRAPFDSVEALVGTMQRVIGTRSPVLTEWVTSQWERARKFRLFTHPDGYVVLEAGSADLLGNIAVPAIPENAVRAVISETEAWIAESETVAVKRALYEAGYPVQDDRDLIRGEPLAIDLTIALRDYQADWVDRFLDAGSGVLVGPPGSGKTIAALGVLSEIGGESLVLVPSRELASQWRDEIVLHTTLTEEQVGEYHGGRKEIRPVTIATYQIAGMDRHRVLFEEREWGVIVYDEVHHVPSPVHRRSAALQSRHRLGLSPSPVREDEQDTEIFTLIGPPIGTDWGALFDAGFVAEPTVEIRYVSWVSEEDRNAYASAEGYEQRQLAAMNPAKTDAVREIMDAHAEKQVLVFVEFLDQGRALAEALGVPFVSGETPHSRRRELFSSFRTGDRRALIVSRVGDEGIDLPEAEVAISASGLGGSRRQGTQRAGRTMRPLGRSWMYVLATRGTVDEDFARRRMQYLSGKGVRVRERETGDA